MSSPVASTIFYGKVRSAIGSERAARDWDGAEQGNVSRLEGSTSVNGQLGEKISGPWSELIIMAVQSQQWWRLIHNS